MSIARAHRASSPPPSLCRACSCWPRRPPPPPARSVIRPRPRCSTRTVLHPDVAAAALSARSSACWPARSARILAARAAAGAAPPAGASAVQGVDVSSFQHGPSVGINWSQVAGAGYKFAFVKAAEGNYYLNNVRRSRPGPGQRRGSVRRAVRLRASRMSPAAHCRPTMPSTTPPSRRARSRCR